MKRVLKVFLLAGSVPLVYVLAWYVCHAIDLYWPNFLNIPVFLMLAAADPWTSFATEFETTVNLNQLFGHGGRKVIQEAALIFGFAFTGTLEFFALAWMSRITSAPKRTR